MQQSTGRLAVGVVLAASLVTFGLQAFVLRPHLWPAGAGVAVSGDTVFGALAAPRPIAVIRPPNLNGLSVTAVTITIVWPGSAAEKAGLRPGMTVSSIADARGHTIRLDQGLPADPAATLGIWREMQRASPQSAITLGVSDGAGATPRVVVLDRQAVWATDAATQAGWLRQHLGPIAQTAGFLAGAAVLLVLGASGTTATLMMLALIATAVANAGPLLGADTAVPILGPLLLLFNWLATPLSFPVIGFAVLFFPHRAEILDRHRWIPMALALASLPMLVISTATAGFLLGADAVAPLVAWFSQRAWTFDASFALLLAANVLIVIEGIGRYRQNLDANERRRIQIVVFTGVPAVFAYALKTGIPLLGGLVGGQPIALYWWVEAFLQAVVLLPAFGLPYAVAVRHVFSPRTVLRRSLQYALARRTIAALVLLPIIALAGSLVQQREQSLAMIIRGRPLFYLFCLGLLGLGLRYREAARRWLDQRFFRAEYDAREILVALASRVPYEADPRQLVAMVVAQIDSALHPECVAVLAENGGAFAVVAAVRADAAPLAGDSALVTLLRWSDRPLEVFLDDESSPVARIPPADRAWLAAIDAALLVPIFAGGSDPRPLVGLVALGQKRSEEPFTPEDRELLRGIAVQMGVALDLSRLRRKASESVIPGGGTQFTPTVVTGTGAGPGIGVGAVVDAKYRVDAIIGQGGMGAVYRAWDLRLARAVAIKVVRADLLSSADARARFHRESQIVARLQHPAIVTVFDYGTLADGAAFLVMEFVPGEDLRQLMRRERTLDPARMLALMDGIAGGVESAHQSGIFHRDLKPENILLPASGTGPKVVDFGVAKLSSPAGTDSGQTFGGTVDGTIIGTPAYMAPEQLRGDAVDSRADVFSLGAMAYEMVTGKLPYGGGSFIDIGMRQAAGEATVDVGGMSEALAAAIRRAIAYDRQSRPDSPVAFAQALKQAFRTTNNQ
ncbi:MAG: protein kinase [Vicinamibacterales bacterium]